MIEAKELSMDKLKEVVGGLKWVLKLELCKHYKNR